MRKFSISVVDDDKQYVCYEGQRLLHAIEGNGCKCVKVGCREGGCGICRIKIHSGSFSTGIMSKAHVSEQEQQQGYALSCRVFPSSDLVIEAAPKAPYSPRPNQSGAGVGPSDR